MIYQHTQCAFHWSLMVLFSHCDLTWNWFALLGFDAFFCFVMTEVTEQEIAVKGKKMTFQNISLEAVNKTRTIGRQHQKIAFLHIFLPIYCTNLQYVCSAYLWNRWRFLRSPVPSDCDSVSIAILSDTPEEGICIAYLLVNRMGPSVLGLELLGCLNHSDSPCWVETCIAPENPLW